MLHVMISKKMIRLAWCVACFVVYTKFKPKTRGKQRTWKLEDNISKLFEDLDVTAWTVFS